MDKGICKGRHHRDDSKASGKGGADQPLLSASANPLPLEPLIKECNVSTLWNLMDYFMYYLMLKWLNIMLVINTCRNILAI